MLAQRLAPLVDGDALLELHVASLEPAEDEEEDLLDKAWGLEPQSRLSCQVLVGKTPLVVEIPRYTINMAREGKH